ncbi:hypothetical protein BV900_28520 [Agrobacterium tumefaciens]|nr:hypothetical protein BV900_28520 [Agrobacterium tumefaciens]
MIPSLFLILVLMSACSEKIEPIEIFFEEPVVFLKGDDTYNIRVKTNAPDTKYFAWGANRDTDESFTGSTFFHEDGYLYLSILHNSKIDVKTTGSNKDQAYMVAPF